MKKNNSGQSLFEVIIALGLVAMIITAVVGLATSTVRNSTFSKDNSVVTKYAQEAIEWIRQQRDTEDWATFVTHTTRVHLGTLSWTVTNDTVSGTSYSRTVAFTCERYDVVSGTKTTLVCPDTTTNSVGVKVTVTWADGQGVHSVSVPTTLTSWKNS